MSAESPATRSQGGFPYAPIFLNVRDVSRSVAFYEKVFAVKPQKQVTDYAEFDLKSPIAELLAGVFKRGGQYRGSLGIEVETIEEIAEWKAPR